MYTDHVMTLISYSQVWCLDPLPLGRALFSRALPAGPRRYLCASQKLNLPSAGLNQAKAFLKNSTLLYSSLLYVYPSLFYACFMSLLFPFIAFLSIFSPRFAWTPGTTRTAVHPVLQMESEKTHPFSLFWLSSRASDGISKLTLSHCFSAPLRCLSHASDGKKLTFFSLFWRGRAAVIPGLPEGRFPHPIHEGGVV